MRMHTKAGMILGPHDTRVVNFLTDRLALIAKVACANNDLIDHRLTVQLSVKWLNK